ncbi:hypothetical protein B0H66DRAFT_604759 [Apodospora peruviana]|uniref:Zn(2)-C6 fungal-type domain-containing protein n=1 Tax=Apodospora peruviana TaxID=516989 RepID=A0AAE0M2L1_9PEZI|nr:hypothetical protein B0H66DRAFT_604759 [Apodospora peruviana]
MDNQSALPAASGPSAPPAPAHQFLLSPVEDAQLPRWFSRHNPMIPIGPELSTSIEACSVAVGTRLRLAQQNLSRNTQRAPDPAMDETVKLNIERLPGNLAMVIEQENWQQFHTFVCDYLIQSIYQVYEEKHDHTRLEVDLQNLKCCIPPFERHDAAIHALLARVLVRSVPGLSILVFDRWVRGMQLVFGKVLVRVPSGYKIQAEMYADMTANQGKQLPSDMTGACDDSNSDTVVPTESTELVGNLISLQDLPADWVPPNPILAQEWHNIRRNGNIIGIRIAPGAVQPPATGAAPRPLTGTLPPPSTTTGAVGLPSPTAGTTAGNKRSRPDNNEETGAQKKKTKEIPLGSAAVFGSPSRSRSSTQSPARSSLGLGSRLASGSYVQNPHLRSVGIPGVASGSSGPRETYCPPIADISEASGYGSTIGEASSAGSTIGKASRARSTIGEASGAAGSESARDTESLRAEEEETTAQREPTTDRAAGFGPSSSAQGYRQPRVDSDTDHTPARIPGSSSIRRRSERLAASSSRFISLDNPGSSLTPVVTPTANPAPVVPAPVIAAPAGSTPANPAPTVTAPPVIASAATDPGPAVAAVAAPAPQPATGFVSRDKLRADEIRRVAQQVQPQNACVQCARGNYTCERDPTGTLGDKCARCTEKNQTCSFQQDKYANLLANHLTNGFGIPAPRACQTCVAAGVPCIIPHPDHHAVFNIKGNASWCCGHCYSIHERNHCSNNPFPRIKKGKVRDD